MPLDLDGFAVFRAIASAPRIFQGDHFRGQQDRPTLAIKQLKAKAADIQNLRNVHQVLGTEFVLVLEGMKQVELKTLVQEI